MIKDIFPRTKHEKEALFKSFLLFFISIEVLLGVIFYLYYSKQVFLLKNQIFLEMKNYSYTFKGEKFNVEIIKKDKNRTFYQLYEDEKNLYILIPIPFVEGEIIKINYPKEKFYENLYQIKKQMMVIFIGFSLIAGVISVMFSIYSLNPLRRSITLIEEFIKDIIHDIGTPVSTILINLKILKYKYKDEEEINRIQNAANQLNLTYNNLKFLLKETEKNLSHVRIDKIINDIVETLKPSFEGIYVDMKLKPMKVYSDETAITRIFINLISNAFKHNIKNGWIKIYILDNEIKIQNSTKKLKNPDKVFDRFYKESQRGIGIGLSIVKKLCDELGYKLNFEYKNNVVTVTLKIKKGAI